MSAQATPAAPPDHVNIEIDGKALQVPKGSMIITAADKIGIPIPRFCYHDKLPIAANCRMCMVEVEKAPKPQPACATPVMEGMKIHTQSQRALSAQRNVMEFLLINHPLDCPICDQGGECELQDLAMGYGRSVSRFSERKRVVADEDIGPLVATDMTRCIQCTRCVRFVSEIAGTYELGGLGRGEHLEIGTYIGKVIESELSGNIIDVCPVGALTNKPFRFRARAWELIARESIGYHDALGSNLFLHTRRGEILRSVPRDNEAINECWLSDRDRYSYQGLASHDRALKPMVRTGGKLIETSWDEAIAFVAKGLKQFSSDQIGALVAPSTSCEEGYLLARMLRGLGSESIDHRLRVIDFSDETAGPTFQMPLVEIEKAAAILIVGGNPRLDQPLLGQRIRKAWKCGGKIFAVNPIDFDFNFDLSAKCIAEPWAMIDELAALAKAAGEGANVTANASIAAAIASAKISDAHRDIVGKLRDASSSVLVFGDFAVQHPAASLLRAMSQFIATATDTAFDEVAGGANAVGLARTGVLPRGKGRNVAQILAEPPKALLLHQAYAADFAEASALPKAQRSAEFVVALTSYANPAELDGVSALLPIGLLPEIDATMINVDGVVQSLEPGAKLPGQARPGWRVLRALGSALGLAEFEFTEIAELRAAMSAAVKTALPASGNDKVAARPAARSGLTRVATVPLYRSDATVRRATALQAHPLNRPACVILNPQDALAAGLAQGSTVQVYGGLGRTTLPLEVSLAVPRGAAWIESGHPETASLGATGTALDVARV